MRFVFRFAFKNIIRQKKKSIFVGLIVFIGSLILILGNSILDSGQKSLKKNFSENFTGDVLITINSDEDLSIIGNRAAGMANMHGQSAKLFNVETSVLPGYARVIDLLSSIDGIESLTSQATGAAELELSNGKKDFIQLFGIDPVSYSKTFDKFKWVEGGMPVSESPGIIISKEKIEEIALNTGTDLNVGDELLLRGFSGTGFKLVSVPLTGIFNLKGSVEFISQFGYLEINSFRKLTGMNVNTAEIAELSQAEMALLDAENIESFFELAANADEAVLSHELPPTGSLSNKVEEDSPGAQWHFIMLKLNKGVSEDNFIKKLNMLFTVNDLQVKAVGWKKAAGSFVMLSMIFQGAFNNSLLAVAIIACAIIINTLTISITERTPEIGTMRAIGAKRGFVRRLIIAEVLIIGGISFTGSVFLSTAALFLLRIIGIRAPGATASVIFGGEVLYPFITTGALFWTLSLIAPVLLITSLAASAKALRVQPVSAMEKA